MDTAKLQAAKEYEAALIELRKHRDNLPDIDQLGPNHREEDEPTLQFDLTKVFVKFTGYNKGISRSITLETNLLIELIPVNFAADYLRRLDNLISEYEQKLLDL